MRSTRVIWIMLFFPGILWGQNASEAPAATVSINAEYDKVALQEVFEELEEYYGVRLAYDHSAIQDIYVVASVENAALEEAIRQILRGTDLEYRMVNVRHVMIRRRDAPGKEESSSVITLSGRVLDALSGEPLAYATVYHPGGQTGTATDESGAFKLPVAADAEILLEVQYLGYAKRLLRLSPSDTNASLSVSLYPKVQEIPGITIEERVPLITSGPEGDRWRLDASALQHLPVSVGSPDLFRSLQLLPGISAADDLSAGLQIRGSDTDESLILLDGITLYRVDHFYGVFSAINPGVIGEVNLFKNAFPSEYGGRTGGVLDMGVHRKVSSAPAPQGAVEVNLLTTSARLQTSLANGVQLLLGGRVSNGDVSDGQLFNLLNQERIRNVDEEDSFSTLSRSALLSRSPDFRFYDLNGSLQWQPDEGSGIDLNFYHSTDRYLNAFENSFVNTLRRVNVRNREVYYEEARWQNTGLSLRGHHQWNARWSTRMTLSHSSYDNSNQMEAALQRAILQRRDTIGVSNRNENGISSYDLHLANEWQMGERHRLKFGYQALFQEVDVHLGVDGSSLLRFERDAWTQALYAEWDARFSPSWSLRLGMRGNYFGSTRQFLPSPRAQLRYTPVEGLWLRASWSRYYQFLREMDYENRFGTSQPFFILANGAAVPVARSNHFAMGAQYLGNGFAVEAEYFRKNTRGLLEYALLRTGFEPGQEAPARQLEYVVFEGTGFVQGLDVLLRKTAGNYTGWIAYTLSKSTNRFDDILNGRSFPASNDRRHQLQIVNQYRAGRWTFSGTYVFASGRPYSNLRDLARLRREPVDRRKLPIEDRLSYLPDYHRVDLGVEYRFPLGAVELELGASVFNLLNRQNVKYRQYVFAIPESLRQTEELRSTVIGNELELLDRTLNLRAGIIF